MKILHSVTASTNSAKYTIKSVSDEGTYYLVKDWRKNRELWVSKENMDRHPEWWFTSSGKAKQSLKSLLSVMDEYLSDTFTVIDDSGNETPLDVKDLGFDHISEYWDDDIDACDKVTGSVKYMANMVNASSSDSRYDENDELYKYYVAGYFDSRLRGLDDNLATNDFDEALNKAHELASNGDYVEITNEITGKSHTYDPDVWMEAIEYGEVPASTRDLF